MRSSKLGGVKVESKVRRTRVLSDVENREPLVGQKITTQITVERRGKRRALADVNSLGLREEPKFRKIDNIAVPAGGKPTRIPTGKVAEVVNSTLKNLPPVVVPVEKVEKSQQPRPVERAVCGRGEILRRQNEVILSVEHYAADIYQYLLGLEKRYLLPSNHLAGQAFNGEMREITVDWLAGVAHHIDLLQETLQLAVYVLDQFMAAEPSKTNKSNAQLVCLGALFVAAKYEELEIIVLDDLVTICNENWTGEDVKSIECSILNAIGYELGRPLPIHFIRRFSKVGEASPMEHNYAKYFADVSLLSYQLCSAKPSAIAAAAIYLAFCVSRGRVDSKFWTPPLIAASTYQLANLRDLLPIIARTVVGAEGKKLNEMRTLYSSPHLFCVSLMPGCRPTTGIINHFCAA